MVQHLWTAIWQYLTNYKMHISFDPTILLLGIYPRNGLTSTQSDVCTKVLTAVLFILAK